ncbi:hypothetical protein R1flu_011027 [Riccia fluitans]|uniref:Uncharacterized protein n=1 Tax=Riccia fluitans TaxID=41844 RepID=A0ABD1Z6N7_9MARC
MAVCGGIRRFAPALVAPEMISNDVLEMKGMTLKSGISTSRLAEEGEESMMVMAGPSFPDNKLSGKLGRESLYGLIIIRVLNQKADRSAATKPP